MPLAPPVEWGLHPGACLIRLWFIQCFATWLILACHAPASAQDLVRVGGTGAGLGGLQALARAYEQHHPDHRISILPSIGSSGGIRAVMDGKLELGCTSRPLLEEERRAGIADIPWASTAFVFATQTATAAEPLTRQLIEDIYAGRRTQWRDGHPIRLILRPKSDTAHSLLADLSPGMRAALDHAHARPGIQVGITDQEALARLEKTPGSFGTTVLGLVLSEGRRVQALTLEGLRASDPTYPHHLPLMLVCRTGELSPATRGFLEFVRSKEGSAILVQTGYQPWAPRPKGNR
jgi:phosphate transport system substrate-binding protein